MNKTRKIFTGSIFITTLLVGFLAKYTDVLVYKSKTPLVSIGVEEVNAAYPGYGYRKSIVIDEAEITGTTTLTNFPILIHITDTQLRTLAWGGRVTQNLGYDIIFTTTSDVLLDHEVESYYSSNGEIYAWVEIPSLSYNVDTTIYMYYGNSNATSPTENPAGVWDSNYKAVWHLDDGTDSTSNGVNGTISGATDTSGISFEGQAFDSGLADRITMPADNAALKTPTTQITIEAWVKRGGAQDTWAKPIWYGNSNVNPYGAYGFQFNNDLDDSLMTQIAGPSSGNFLSATQATTISDNTWYYLVGRYNNPSLTHFINGVAGTTGTTSGYNVANYAAGESFRIGGSIAGSDPFVGTVDEVRISNIARSNDWIQASYATMDPNNHGVGAGKFIQSMGNEEVMNTAPTVNSVSASYGTNRSRASVNNTPITINYNATDSEQTGANQLTFYIHTGANRTGTQVATGTFQSGARTTTIAYNATGIVNGTNTLYMSVFDGTVYSNNPSFTYLRDDTAPTASTSISTNPGTVTGNYTVTFTPNDAVSTGSNEMSYQIRTATGGGGTLLTSGNANSTSGQAKTTGTISGDSLSQGANTRYVRACDGANNCTDTAFTVTATVPPSGVTTSAESGLASYKVTLNGSANPNGSQAYGYFRYFTSAPDCTVDSGGTRMPSSSAADLPLGSGSSPVAFNYTTPPTVLLVPNTNYWYCAYSRNAAAGQGTPGTAAAAGYDTFTTPDGGASGCDAPASGDITITESCTFPQSDNDGVDSGGSGATNTARIILNSGGNITILPGQRIARGSLQTNGGSFSIGNGGGSVIRGGVWIKDTDGDGIIDSPVVKTVSNTQPAGYVRRNHLYTQPTYNNSTFNYASKMYNAETTAPTYLDCDQTNANIWRNVQALRPDTDADGYADTPAAGNQYCVGGQLTNVNGSGRTYYRGATGSPAYVLASQALNATGRQDCDINSAKPCPPAAGLSASAVAGGTQMTVNYTASSSSGPAASSHVVKYMSGSQNASTLLASGSTTGSFTSGTNIGSLSPSTLYSFGLLASNTSGSATLLSNVFQQTTAAACVTAYPDNDQDSYGSSGVIGRGVLSKTSTNGQTSITVTKPADVVNGQLLIAGVGYSGSVTSSGISITAPAGWNLIQNSNSGSNVEGVAMYWKIASGEPVNYTWSFIRISNSTAHATDANAWVIAYDNVNTSNPINASGVNSGNHGQTSSSANDTASAITTTAANTMVIGAMHSDRGQTTFDPVSGMNTTMNVSPGSGYAATISFDAVQASIGSTGTKSSLHTLGGGWAAVMVALNPRSTTSQCVALPSAGWSANQSDCEDNTTSYYQNLNGYLDADGDGVASSGQTSACSGGSLRPGVPSTPGTDCDSNNGAKWQNLTGYIDTDNDNHSPSTSQQICSGSALPSGYKSSVTSTNDCYDLNSNARPSQSGWFTTTRGGGNDSAGNTGNSYDYNCVSGAEPQTTAYICNTTTLIHAAPGCAPDPECPPLCWDACCGCTPYCGYMPDTVYCTSVSGSAATCGGAYSTNSYYGFQQDSSSCGGNGSNYNTYDYSSALPCH